MDVLSEHSARVEISNITVLSHGEFGEPGDGHGAEMEAPRRVDVVFPAPFEVDNGGAGVSWARSQPLAGWEAERTRSASCRRLCYKTVGGGGRGGGGRGLGQALVVCGGVPHPSRRPSILPHPTPLNSPKEDAADDTIPTCALEFDGARTLDGRASARSVDPVVGNLHVLLRVMIPTTVGAVRGSATSAQAEKETLVAGQCVLSLAQLRQGARGGGGEGGRGLGRTMEVVLEDGGVPLVLEDHGQVTVRLTLSVVGLGT